MSGGTRDPMRNSPKFSRRVPFTAHVLSVDLFQLRLVLKNSCFTARQIQVLFVLNLRLGQMTCPHFCLYKMELIVTVFHRAPERLNENVSVRGSTLQGKPGSFSILIISSS